MVDFETVLFIEKLRDLAARTNNGFLPFSQVESKSNGEIVYDDSVDDEQGYPIIIGDKMLGIIDTFDGNDYTMRVLFYDNGAPYVHVSSFDGEYHFIIESGVWYSI